ncbi:MAG: PolC-type DNA polymerase III [Ruminococcaceae bacterium]|nr:PolC-type DNA polymerase III [Oscillospiraceae bacterium]
MKKNLIELFSKYRPSEEDRAWLSLAPADSIRLQYDSEQKRIEIFASFPHIIRRPVLTGVEEGIRQAYELNFVHFCPQYDAALFSEAYIPELLFETNRMGIVANGFFNNCHYRLIGDRIDVEIPFPKSGVKLVCDAKTPELMAEILRREFGISLQINIVQEKDYDPSFQAGRMEGQLREMRQEAARAAREYEQAQQLQSQFNGKGGAEEAEKEMLPRVPSIYGDVDPTPQFLEDGTCRIGNLLFDVSSPEVVYGSSFELRPIPIASINHPMNNIVIFGEVTGYTAEENRTGDKIDVTFDIYDGNASIEHRTFGMEVEEARELASIVQVGGVYAMRGRAKQNTRKGKTDTDFTFYYTDIARISKITRKDRAPQKRVELHLHTTMSTMDALIPPDQVVKTALKWGHPAIAITDHGNVQGFPDAMLALEKNASEEKPLKLIYGIESYFVNDTAGAVSGACDPDFNTECVVFDIETTGLSVQNCKITEIGAVKICNGEVLERFNTFVNPQVPIPEEIVKLTGITNEMVADAPLVGDALRSFFSFIGNDRVEEGKPFPLLIAHNANFDVGFIRYFAAQEGLPFANPYLDTVALSKHLNRELKSHKLDVLAKHYKLGEFNHHRACDDAEMLAMIYFQMIDQMQKSELRDFNSLKKEMTEQADPLKLPTYHQILLVKNQTGLKNLYKLISYSYLNYFRRNPRIPKTVLEKHREGLIVGSACESGELIRALLENRPDSEIEEIVNFYDYLEIQPICNNRFLIAEGKIADDEGLRDLNRRVVALGERYNKPVCATCDAHFLNPEDELFRKILLAGMKFKDYDKDVGIYLRTTEEMLEEFSYLGEEKAFEVVVLNTNKIADMIEQIRPIPKGSYTPEMEGAEQELQDMCWARAKSMYGDPLPELVSARLERELTSIIKNGFAVLYLIAQRLVHYSEEQGYLVGSRGSVGSSFVATMAGISEVNPLPPHYYCPNPACKHNEFFTNGEVGSGFDLPDKVCPKCGTKYKADGHDIMFETFLGFYGDKSPDIDLNFSGDVQGRVHKYTEELFGEGHVFRAGTLGTLADKTAFGYVAKYVEQKGISLPRAEINRLVSGCTGVKKLTGQHPGGIIVVPQKYEVYDFTPVQHPADDPNSDIITTHFAFSYLHDTILKLDELGHDIPTKYKWLETFTNTSVNDVAMNDRSVYELFESTRPLGIEPEDIEGCTIGTYGLPELGTPFIQQVLLDAKPRNFADLLQISGLTHGTNVWLGNAQDLIKEGICDISRVIGTRDGIMLDMIRYGLDNAMSFKIMEAVRKGKGLTPEWEAAMVEHNVPEWYILSCKKIKYLFPKAHAAAYVMSAIRLAWYKVHQPVAFYCTMFTVAPNGFDASVVRGGKNHVVAVMRDIQKRGKEASPKEQASIPTMQLINEAMARGIRFLPVDLKKSHSFIFQPENGAIRMPFSSLPGLGETAAESIIRARNEEEFFSVEDLQIRAKLSRAVIEILRENGALEDVDETDQLTIKF